MCPIKGLGASVSIDIFTRFGIVPVTDGGREHLMHRFSLRARIWKEVKGGKKGKSSRFRLA